MALSWHDSHRKETEEGAITAQAEHSWSLLSLNVLKDPYVSLSYVSISEGHLLWMTFS